MAQYLQKLWLNILKVPENLYQEINLIGNELRTWKPRAALLESGSTLMVPCVSLFEFIVFYSCLKFRKNLTSLIRTNDLYHNSTVKQRAITEGISCLSDQVLFCVYHTADMEGAEGIPRQGFFLYQVSILPRRAGEWIEVRETSCP